MINILLTSQVNSNDVSTPHKKSALNFFLIVYGLSLPLWLLQLFIGDSSLPLNIPITDIVAAFTPLFAACILTYKIEGKQGVQQLLVRIVDVKKNKTYLVVHNNRTTRSNFFFNLFFIKDCTL